MCDITCIPNVCHTSDISNISGISRVITEAAIFLKHVDTVVFSVKKVGGGDSEEKHCAFRLGDYGIHYRSLAV